MLLGCGSASDGAEIADRRSPARAGETVPPEPAGRPLVRGSGRVGRPCHNWAHVVGTVSKHARRCQSHASAIIVRAASLGGMA